MKEFLLDTHTFLWIINDDPRLSDNAREIFLDPDNQLWLSDVSSWEISIKAGLGRLELPAPAVTFIPSQLRQNGIASYGIRLEHTLSVEALPLHHRDPFDRLLAVQALGGLPLVSRDKVFDRYGVTRIWD